MKNLTRQQNPDSIKIGEDTTFEPDKLQSTKVDDLRVTKTVRSIDQNDAIPDMQEPLIKSPQQPKPPLVLSPELQEKQPSTVTNKSPLNEVVVVGSDPTKIEVDTKEMEVLPTLTDVVENKSEIDKKEEEKNIKEVVTSS